MLPIFIPTEAGGVPAFQPRINATAQGRTDGKIAFDTVMSDEQASAGEPSILPTTAGSIAQDPGTRRPNASGPTLIPKVAPETSVSAAEGMSPSDDLGESAFSSDRTKAGRDTARSGQPARQAPVSRTPLTPVGGLEETSQPDGAADKGLRSDASAPLEVAMGDIEPPLRSRSTPQGDIPGIPAAPNAPDAAPAAGQTADSSAAPGPAFSSGPGDETEPQEPPTDAGERPRLSSELSLPGDSARVAGDVDDAGVPGMGSAIPSEQGPSLSGDGSAREADATVKPAAGQPGEPGTAAPRTERAQASEQVRANADPGRFQAATGAGEEVVGAVYPATARPALPAAEYPVSVRTAGRAVPQDAPPVVPLPRQGTAVPESLRPETDGRPTSGAGERGNTVLPRRSPATATGTSVPTVGPESGAIPQPTNARGDGADVATPTVAAAAVEASPIPVALPGAVAVKAVPARAMAVSLEEDQIARPATWQFSDRQQGDLRPPSPGHFGAAAFGHPFSSTPSEPAIAPIVIEKAIGTAAPDQVSELALPSLETPNRTPTAASFTPTTAPDLPRAQAVVQQIADAARLGPEGQIEVTLSPEELGRVRLTMSPADAGLAVLVQADREETLELLRRNIDILARELADQGYGALDFSFGHTGRGSGERQGSADAAILDALQSDGQGSFDRRTDPRPSGVTASGHLDLRL